MSITSKIETLLEANGVEGKPNLKSYKDIPQKLLDEVVKRISSNVGGLNVVGSLSPEGKRKPLGSAVEVFVYKGKASWSGLSDLDGVIELEVKPATHSPGKWVLAGLATVTFKKNVALRGDYSLDANNVISSRSWTYSTSTF